MWRTVECEEELAVVGAGLVLVGHGYLPAMVELDARVNLVSKGLSVDALSSLARAGGVTALNHELPNHPVEHRVVVVLCVRAVEAKEMIEGGARRSQLVASIAI